MTYVSVFKGESSCPEEDCYFSFVCEGIDEEQVGRIMQTVVELHHRSSHPDQEYHSVLVPLYDKNADKKLN